MHGTSQDQSALVAATPSRLARLCRELLERVPPPVNLHGHALLEQVHVLEVLAPEVVHLGQCQEPGRLARQTRPHRLDVRQLDVERKRVCGNRCYGGTAVRAVSPVSGNYTVASNRADEMSMQY